MGGTTQGSEYQGVQLCGGILDAGYHIQPDPHICFQGTPDICKIQYTQPQKEGICTIWKMRPKEGEALKTEQGGQKSRSTMSERFSLSAQPGQVTAPARSQWPHLDNEDQPDDAVVQ